MSSRDIAVVGFAHAPHVRSTEGTTNGVEMLRRRGALPLPEAVRLARQVASAISRRRCS